MSLGLYLDLLENHERGSGIFSKLAPHLSHCRSHGENSSPSTTGQVATQHHISSNPGPQKQPMERNIWFSNTFRILGPLAISTHSLLTSQEQTESQPAPIPGLLDSFPNLIPESESTIVISVVWQFTHFLLDKEKLLLTPPH